MQNRERDSRWLERGAALAVVTALFFLAREEEVSAHERERLADRFAFSRARLPELERESFRTSRDVCARLRHISAWISSVGGAAAFCDLDGDGLENDVVFVETRSDRIVVCPVPDSGDRYEPFVLPTPSGRDERVAPMGCLPGDFDEDGRTDLLSYSWGRPPVLHLFRGDGAPSAAAFEAHDLAPSEERWYTNTATRADVDGDGHPDLVFGNYFPDGARVLDPTWEGEARMQHSMSRAANGGTNRLFLWSAAAPAERPFVEAQGAFVDLDATAWTLAVAAADLDGDQLPELYFANDFGPDVLLRNTSAPGTPRFRRLVGAREFTTPSSKVLGRDSFKGMGVDFGDVNGDCVPDIWVSNITDAYALEESQFLFVSTDAAREPWGDLAPYRDESERLGVSRTGWGWDAKLCDLDNDSVLEALQATGFVRGETDRWPELQEVATGNDELLRHPEAWPRFGEGDDLCGRQRNPFFVRDARGRFCDVSAELGLADTPVTRAVAVADVDGDGDLDLAYGNQWEASTFHRNLSSGAGRALVLRVRVPIAAGGAAGATRVLADGALAGEPTRAAIGATVLVRLPDGRRLWGQVDGGNGHSGVRGKEVHFGLGALEPDAELEVEVRWRGSDGLARVETLALEPGRHTLLLGRDGERP